MTNILSYQQKVIERKNFWNIGKFGNARKFNCYFYLQKRREKVNFFDLIDLFHSKGNFFLFFFMKQSINLSFTIRT